MFATSRRAPGMSLLEVTVGSAMFSLIMALFFSVTHWTTKAFQEQVLDGTQINKGEMAVRTIEDELSDGTLASVTAPLIPVTINTPLGPRDLPNACVKYKLPLRFKSTGNASGYAFFIDELTNSDATFVKDNVKGGDLQFTLRWGWRDNNRYVTNADDSSAMVWLQGPGLNPGSAPLPTGVTKSTGFTDGTNVSGVTPRVYPSGTLYSGTMCIRFQVNTGASLGKYGKNGFISEYQEGIDLDGDGSLNTLFAIGYLERCYCVGPNGGISGFDELIPESRQPIGGDSAILLPVPNPSPNSGPPDKLKSNLLFYQEIDPVSLTAITPARISVSMWMLRWLPEGEPHLQHFRTSVFLRNNAKATTAANAASATGTN
jgi:hypothetical protein